jgi:hypothetical protein
VLVVGGVAVVFVAGGAAAGGVGVGDGVGGGVAVAVELGGVGGVEDGLEAEELAGIRVVEAGAQDGQAGGLVGGFAEEAVGVGPAGWWGAAGAP